MFHVWFFPEITHIIVHCYQTILSWWVIYVDIATFPQQKESFFFIFIFKEDTKWRCQTHKITFMLIHSRTYFVNWSIIVFFISKCCRTFEKTNAELLLFFFVCSKVIYVILIKYRLISCFLECFLYGNGSHFNLYFVRLGKKFLSTKLYTKIVHIMNT